MTRCPTWARATLAATTILGASTAHGGIIGTQWLRVGPSEVWLYALAEENTVLLNADLGDTNIDQAPDGVNNGLYSTDGAVLNSSSLTIEPRDGSLFAPRPLSITPSGSGSHLDAAWFTDDPSFAAFVDFGSGPTQAFLLARIDLEFNTTTIGGPNGGPTGDIQSRIYIGWTDEFLRGTAQFGVFDIPEIPAPPTALIAAPLIAASSRRRRTTTRH